MSEFMNTLGVTNEWLVVTGAIAMLISLAEAWIATLIVYGKVGFLKKIFPATQNLIRSHVDYTIMVALIGFTYFVIDHFSVDVPKSIILITCIGVLYNPFGFLIKAINPKAGHGDSFASKLMVCIGFLPATIGFGYTMILVLQHLL